MSGKVDLSQFVGQHTREKNIWPARFATGQVFIAENGLYNRIDLGEGKFYVLPPGHAIAENHEDLLKFASGGKSTTGVQLKDKPDSGKKGTSDENKDS